MSEGDTIELETREQEMCEREKEKESRIDRKNKSPADGSRVGDLWVHSRRNHSVCST